MALLKVFALVPEEEAELGVSVPRLVVGGCRGECRLPRDPSVIQSPHAYQVISQVLLESHARRVESYRLVMPLERLQEVALAFQTEPEFGMEEGRTRVHRKSTAEVADSSILSAQIKQSPREVLVVIVGRRVDIGGSSELLDGLFAATQFQERAAEHVVAQRRPRPDRNGRLKVTERFPVPSVFCQKVAQPHVEPVVVGVRLLVSPQ